MSDLILIMKRPGNIAVMQQAVAELGLSAAGVTDEGELCELLADARCPRLALVDVTGFGAPAWRMCAALQERDVPFVVLSAPKDIEAGSRTLEFGASSFLQKPIAKSALLQLIRSLTE